MRHLEIGDPSEDGKIISQTTLMPTCVILLKSRPGLGLGRTSASWRRLRRGLRRSQGWEWHRGSAGCRSRLEVDGVLQAEVGDGGRVGCPMPPQPHQPTCAIAAVAGEGRGDRSNDEASSMWTGEREKRRCRCGAGEQEDEDGEAMEVEQPPFSLVQLSHWKLHGSGESDDSAKLKNVGLDEEWRDEEVKEELGPKNGKELEPAAELELDARPLRESRFTGVQTLDAVGCQVERQRGKSSGTERDRQWRFGGGGGGGGELCRAAKETSGARTSSPKWEWGHCASGPEEIPKLLAWGPGWIVEKGSKHRQTDMTQTVMLKILTASLIFIGCRPTYLVLIYMHSTRQWDLSRQQVGTKKHWYQLHLKKQNLTK